VEEVVEGGQLLVGGGRVDLGKRREWGGRRHAL
jgi:hypothetical protein